MRSVLVVTSLRIQALWNVTSPDMTYSRCYLGLLSEIGAYATIITACMPALGGWYWYYRSRKESKRRDTRLRYELEAMSSSLSTWGSKRPKKVRRKSERRRKAWRIIVKFPNIFTFKIALLRRTRLAMQRTLQNRKQARYTKFQEIRARLHSSSQVNIQSCLSSSGQGLR